MLTINTQPAQAGKKSFGDIPRPLLSQLLKQAESDVHEGHVHTLNEVKKTVRGWI